MGDYKADFTKSAIGMVHAFCGFIVELEIIYGLLMSINSLLNIDLISRTVYVI